MNQSRTAGKLYISLKLRCPNYKTNSDSHVDALAPSVCRPATSYKSCPYRVEVNAKVQDLEKRCTVHTTRITGDFSPITNKLAKSFHNTTA